ncbi:succinyl-diaminopimelate desuccinylase [Yimella sp. cx-51]|uniref:succinyl-diaminopimelate desuccinylase n=1 Tax=Yimella sp. cx-51 TaxID=2770551 RepID=UPI00165D3130|nr:succinyl-diaminopimelate desuccinylase [Yimella sp. cx-51]MBC9956032.1 succinyl-diaminopimelate desuccinylase [Yimella sp. cx-51]QTH37431.1 succinyl-diaminopimelate desuccinylase [Yimella sp. cx-51]
MASLDLNADVVDLTVALCDIPSVSKDETRIADAIQEALRPLAHLEVVRDGNVVIARTDLGRAERVVLAGHIDTVPITDPPNLPVHRQDGRLRGRGTTDMKAGVAVQLALAAQVTEPTRDITFVFYDCEEIEAEFNGLARIAREHPEWLEADFAVLLEPTNGGIEGGCKGTMRVDVSAKGIAAHSARPWNGHNAIHEAGEILARLAKYEPRTVNVEGLDYHEALNAVGIEGGIAGNVIPDRCVVSVNYRYAPDRDTEEALAHLRDVFNGYEVTLKDAADGAKPGLDKPAAQGFVAALALPVIGKEGWTDVAQFSALGVPAVNFGPGDPNLAHTDDEWCPEQQITDGLAAMRRWLSPDAASTGQEEQR